MSELKAILGPDQEIMDSSSWCYLMDKTMKAVPVAKVKFWRYLWTYEADTLGWTMSSPVSR